LSDNVELASTLSGNLSFEFELCTRRRRDIRTDLSA